MRVDGSANPTMPKNPAQYLTWTWVMACGGGHAEAIEATAAAATAELGTVAAAVEATGLGGTERRRHTGATHIDTQL